MGSLYWILCLALASNIKLSKSTEVEENAVHTQNFQSTAKELYKCTAKDGAVGLLNCATLRALKMLQVADRKEAMEVLPGVVLEKVPGAEGVRKTRKLDLPLEAKEKEAKLTEALVENVADFVSSRTLKFQIPNMARALSEARGKMKKVLSPTALWIGAKLLSTIPLFLLGVGFVSAKALIIAKIAFVFAIILFFQYYTGAGKSLIGSPYNYGTGATYGTGTWTTNNLGPQYPYARSIDVVPGDGGKSAQEMAYSAQKEQQ